MAKAGGKKEKLPGCAGPEFLLEIGLMCIHGSRADAQAGSDFPRASPFPDESEDFLLPLGQCRWRCGFIEHVRGVGRLQK